jgi:hypothetical protein
VAYASFIIFSSFSFVTSGSRIHRKGHRNKPLSEREKRGNKTRSKVRARVKIRWRP